MGQLLAAAARPAALLGMHLCGALSLRAIEAFVHLDSIKALALSPCCLPKKGDVASAPPELFASKDSAQQYSAWAAHLEARLLRDAPTAAVGSRAVADVLSPKNVVICA